MKCQKCGSKDNLTVMRTVHINNKKYTYYICRPCNATKRMHFYHHGGKGTIARVNKRYEDRNPQRRKAWSQAFSLGNKPCEVCGEEKADKHHPDINKALEVVWLCRPHHKEAHNVLH